MGPFEIILIILVVLFFLGLVGNYLYRKFKHLPSGGCGDCTINAKRLLKEYRKAYPPTSPSSSDIENSKKK